MHIEIGIYSVEATSFIASQRENRSTKAAGVSFFIRKAKGMTRHLRSQENLFTLLEGRTRTHTHHSYSSVIACCSTSSMFLDTNGVMIDS
jgi:hypothetical protein